MLSFYEIDDDYIMYLNKYDENVSLPKVGERRFVRKYVGIIVPINNSKYFIPLTSYKPMYDDMYESLSLKKISNMGILRINNMIPANESVIHKIDFDDIDDKKYKYLCINEYRLIKKREREIRKDARIVYYYRINPINEGKKLYNICCNFKLLENKLLEYSRKQEIRK